ncbi:MAG: hypothetical protein U1U88_000445 [Lawsonella clevelandensis]
MEDATGAEIISVAALEEACRSYQLDYLALGDRHSQTQVGESGRIWYSGSPEVTDFDDVEKTQARHSSSHCMTRPVRPNHSPAGNGPSEPFVVTSIAPPISHNSPGTSRRYPTNDAPPSALVLTPPSPSKTWQH